MIYLNGKFLPLQEARISVLDRGFMFGDGVYEVIPVYARRPLRAREHLKRLQDSLDAIRLSNPMHAEEWLDVIAQIVGQGEAEDQQVYIQVTRGPAPRDHAFPKEVYPTVLVMSSRLAAPSPEQVERGVAAITAIDYRWLRCNVKAISLLANVLLRQMAVDAEAAECILLRNGYLTEGAASNIFIIHRDTLLAPPKDHLMLSGITYDLVLELAAQHNIRYSIRPIPETELWAAQEVMMTSSTREILAITTLNGKPVGTGKPGSYARRLLQLYQAYKLSLVHPTAKEPA
jgi:D-alanine transaminase